MFKDKGLPDEIPIFKLKWEDKEMWLPRIMKDSGLVKSTGEAIRLIKQGGVSVDGKRWDDPDKKLPEGEYLFKAGKRKFLKIINERGS